MHRRRETLLIEEEVSKGLKVFDLRYVTWLLVSGSEARAALRACLAAASSSLAWFHSVVICSFQSGSRVISFTLSLMMARAYLTS